MSSVRTNDHPNQCPEVKQQRVRRLNFINHNLRTIRQQLTTCMPADHRCQTLLAREAALLAQKRAVIKRYDPDLPLAVSLASARGDTIVVRTDCLTEESKWIYLNGQCMAMAHALSLRMTGMVLVHTVGSYWLEDGDITSPTLRHAYALAPDGMAWDIQGESDPRTLELEEGEYLLSMTSSEAQERFSRVLPPQDYEIAMIYADMVIECTQTQQR